MNFYRYQKQVAQLIRQGHNVILQAPTGAGKTLAALWPFLVGWADEANNVPRKCIYTVPMRVLANQFDEEYKKIVYKKMLLRAPPRIAKQTGEYKEDPEFLADLTFATIDQALSSWLMHPYSLSKRKGNLNAGALVGSYLIFDEFHLFSPDSTLPVTLQMLKSLAGISPFLLMTATFSAEMLAELAQDLNAVPVLLKPTDLEEIPAQKKERIFHTVARCLVTEDELYVDNIITTHLNQPEGEQRSLVVCNQVERAQKIYLALKERELDGVEVRLLHSRFVQRDRQELEKEVRQEFQKEGKNHKYKSLILVATQVVEVGLDMSCKVLHTELAPAASVLQRAGRCARYEGEVGHVYVYPVEKYAPYHGREAKQQCELTWAWLQANKGRHLDFTDEQALINHAHTPTDRRILAGLRSSKFEWKEKVYRLWRGEGARAEASRLIRNIQSVSLAVHSDPDQLRHAPFAVDTFSLHPGTLQKKFAIWDEQNADDFEREPLPWLLQRLVEEEDEEEIQGNWPIRYAFAPVRNKYQLHAPLLVVHPALVGYSDDLGLTLYPGAAYQCDPPPQTQQRTRAAYGYRLESYQRHIELVYREFEVESLALLGAAASRIEQCFGWQKGIIEQIAQLVILLHDVGKLSQGWQGWATAWQQGIGKPLPPATAVAHTDYDPTNEMHVALDRKMRGTRPTHAVESAVAATPLLTAILPDDQQYRPLLRAAFTAICRHHGPFTSQSASFKLVPAHAQAITETMQKLSGQLPVQCRADRIKSVFQFSKGFQRNVIERKLLVDPADHQSMVCYMLLVRALRRADQEGTKAGLKI